MRKLDNSTVGNLELACHITHAHAEKVRACWNVITQRVPNVQAPTMECSGGEVIVYWGDKSERPSKTPVLTLVIGSGRRAEWTLTSPGYIDAGDSHPDDELSVHLGLHASFFKHLKRLFCQKEDAPC